MDFESLKIKLRPVAEQSGETTVAIVKSKQKQLTET